MEMKPVPTGRPGVRLVDEQGVGAVIVPWVWVCSWRIRYFARLDGRSLRSWKKITGFCFYHVNGRDDWGPWNQTWAKPIALRPDTQTPKPRPTTATPLMRLPGNGTVGHCTALPHRKRPQDREPAKPASKPPPVS